MSEYTGHVEPHRPAVRELPELTITKVSVGSMDNNAYLLRSTRTGAGLLIDAADEAPVLLQVIGEGGLEAIVTTHGDADHWQALEEVGRATGAKLYAPPLDARRIPVSTDPLDDGDTVQVGPIALEVLRLPGHTPGHIALLYRDPEGSAHLFAGDCIFPGGPGRTTSPANFESLMTALEEKVYARLPDDTWVYVGHGDDTTVGAERPHLGEYRARGW
ncbi:MAG: MBL fold metallo-hydrolase [Candidatus Dormibacteraceae bacterium]